MHLGKYPLLNVRSRLWCLPLACILLAGVPLGAHSQGAAPLPIPALQRTGDQFQLLVDGQPYLILGGQAHNSSASNVNDAEAAYKALDYMHANTAEIPISWNLIEPEPGKFDFTLVDGLIERARAHQLRLVFLWFGTAKNGTFSYVPDWVKQDRTKYFRARNSRGGEMNALSPFCDAALMADERAFAALMHHIRDVDTNERTVILMQVENEVGLGGTDRDYSSPANLAFAEAVPADVMSYLVSHKETLRPAMYEAWQQSGFRPQGTWTEVLGDMGQEAFSAWSVSRYVDGVTAAGKAEYPIPYYLNVSLMNGISPRRRLAERWGYGSCHRYMEGQRAAHRLHRARHLPR
jgi:beta-galactosidase GanA